MSTDPRAELTREERADGTILLLRALRQAIVHGDFPDDPEQVVELLDEIWGPRECAS